MLYSIVRPILFETMDIFRRQMIAELRYQKHVHTGNLIESLEIKVESTGDGLTGYITAMDYATYLNNGVKNINYTEGSGNKSSKYIDALIKWWSTKPGVDNPVRAAFNTARKQKVEGNPTVHSRTMAPRRTNFIDHAVTESQDDALTYVEQTLGETLSKKLAEAIADKFNNI